MSKGSSSITTLTGSNRFALREALKKIVEDFTSEFDAYGVERFEADNTEFPKIMDSIASQPFLTEKKLVIIEDPGANTDVKDKIEQILDSTSESTILVFFEPKIDKRGSLYKTLKKRTDFKEFNDLDEQQLASWVADTAKERGGSIQPTDARLLVQRTGLGQAGLSNEIDKLLSYNPNITKDSILLLTEASPQGTVFDLMDAVFRGDLKKVMSLYESQREQQVEPQAIMGMLAWQVHTMAVVGAQQSQDVNAIAQATGINPFVVRKTLSLTNKHSLKEIKDLVHKTLELDIRLKSESIDADEALQEYLISLK